MITYSNILINILISDYCYFKKILEYVHFIDIYTYDILSLMCRTYNIFIIDILKL